MEVEESKVWLYNTQQSQPWTRELEITDTFQVLSMHQKRMRRASSQVVEVGEEETKRRREEGEEEEPAQPGEEKRMKGEGDKTDNEEEAETVVLACNDDSNIGNESDSDADYDDLDDLVVNR